MKLGPSGTGLVIIGLGSHEESHSAFTVQHFPTDILYIIMFIDSKSLVINCTQCLFSSSSVSSGNFI